MNPTTRPTRSATSPTIEPLEARIAPAAGAGAVIDLGSLDGTNGFVLNGVAAGHQAGMSVSDAGDVNGDGFDDVVVSAIFAAPNGPGSGASYVVFGKASGFAAAVELSSLDGTNGFALNGAAGDNAGFSVSAAGDVNDDGFDDLIIGASGAGPNGQYSGASCVVFGKASGFTAALNLSTLDGTNGFVIRGVAAFDFSSRSVSGAGDVNGDGFDDVIIGARGADPNGSASGASYVVFGKATGFAASFELSALDGNNGFALHGAAANDNAGYSVSGAGDVNGDGFDDVLIGARYADPNGDASGAGYVVFGKASGFSPTLNLSTLDGTNGFAVNGVAALDFSSRPVSGAGDVNGDGFDDLLVGALGADPNGEYSGASYVVFGKASGFSATLNLSTLDGTNGFALHGAVADDQFGYSVSAAGDVNGDGFDDVLIGAVGADPNADRTGASYVVFGKATAFTAAFELSSLNGLNGFALHGVAALDFSGFSVSAAGDVNGDGCDDVIIGAIAADPNGSDSGAGYVVFGQAGVQASESTVVVLDADGDVLTIKVKGGTLTPQDISRDDDGNIAKIDLTRLAAMAQAGGKAINVNLKVKIPPGGLGDGTALVGQLDATGVNLGKVKLKGDLGQLFAGTGAGVLKLLKVTGDLGKPGETTEVKATVNGLMVGGDLTGEVIADNFKKVNIGGNIGNGTLQASGGIGSLKVAAKIINSTMKLGTKIGTLLVLGDVENSTVRVKDTLTKLDVRGDVIDSEITVLGKLGATSAAKAVALKSVKVGGDFVRSKLLAGYDATGTAMNADVSLGTITIAGNFEASSIVAGATAGVNGFFGDEDDALISGGGAVVARIASITIKGTVLGSATLGDHFGLVAEEIGKLKIGSTTQTLTPGPGNDTTPIALGGTADVKAREVAVI